MADNDDNINEQNDDVNNNDNYIEDVCRVYDKDDFFTVFVQILLGCLALMSLYIKRLQEVPRRTFKTWFMDVMKQGFGAVYAHILNMASETKTKRARNNMKPSSSQKFSSTLIPSLCLL